MNENILLNINEKGNEMNLISEIDYDTLPSFDLRTCCCSIFTTGFAL